MGRGRAASPHAAPWPTLTDKRGGDVPWELSEDLRGRGSRRTTLARLLAEGGLAGRPDSSVRRELTYSARPLKDQPMPLTARQRAHARSALEE